MATASIHGLVGIACMCGLVTVAGAARVIYVDAGAVGAGNGSSWQNAFPYLQDALAAAATAAKPVEIRVAQGVYKPNRRAGGRPGDRTATFQLPNGVALLGGYGGTAAPDPNARDIKLCETILSGDLENNDGLVYGDDQDNSCYIATCRSLDSTAVIDGFSFTKGGSPFLCGDADGPGAAILIEGGSPVIRNCRFNSGLLIRDGSTATIVACTFKGGLTLNEASDPDFIDCTFDQGGMSNLRSAPTVTNCRFEGGAMYNDLGGSPSLTGCVFTGNQICAVKNRTGSRPTFTNCRFEKNPWMAMENEPGSGIVLAGCAFADNELYGMSGSDCNAVLSDCAFERNGRFLFGGGAIHWSGGALTLLRCQFLENQDGAIDCHGTLTARSCVFRGNKSHLAGAIYHSGPAFLYDCAFIANLDTAICNMGGQLYATGCVFAGNLGLYQAGAIDHRGTLLLLTNCTFVGNHGVPNTIRDYGTRAAAAKLTQCIVWDGPAPFTDSTGKPPRIQVTYSDVQGGYPGEGNLDMDPCFVAGGYWANPNDLDSVVSPQDPHAVWMNGDYHLKSQAGHWDRATQTWVRDDATSRCIDAADPNAPLGDEPFPNGAAVNLGAYGGTVEASKSYFSEPVCQTQRADDLNGDCLVDATDTHILTDHRPSQMAGRVIVPPTVVLDSPEDGADISYPMTIFLSANATDADGWTVGVTFIARHVGSGRQYVFHDTDPADGWNYGWFWWRTTDVPFAGAYEIWAEAVDDDGAVVTSVKITVTCRTK